MKAAEQAALCVLVRTKEPKIEWHATQGTPGQLTEYLAKTAYVTLSYLLRSLQARNPATLKVCTLLDRVVSRIIDVPIAYQGFELPDVFDSGSSVPVVATAPQKGRGRVLSVGYSSIPIRPR